MAVISKYFTTTCIDLDLTDATENTCNEIFKAFGKYRKLQLQFLLEFTFPEFYKTGHIDEPLAKLIKKYKKDFPAKRAKNPVFFGWSYQGGHKEQLSDDLLNRQLCGGAKDFIVYLLKATYPHFFNNESPVAAITADDTLEATLSENVLDLQENEVENEDSDDDEDFLQAIRHQFDHMNTRATISN